MYQGILPGRPKLESETRAVARGVLLSNMHTTRNAVTGEKAAQLQLISIRTSQQERGIKVSPPGWTPSTQWIRAQNKVVGIGSRKCGYDNQSRQRALLSPRNVITNFAGLLGVCDARYTVDGKDVHPAGRLNMDAVTIFNVSDHGGTVQTLCKRTPLMDAYETLAEAFAESKSVPATMSAEKSLNQVCNVIISILIYVRTSNTLYSQLNVDTLSRQHTPYNTLKYKFTFTLTIYFICNKTTLTFDTTRTYN